MSDFERDKINNWFAENVSGKSDYLYIPPHQESAFLGVLAHSENPTIAILDFHTCVENLQKLGMEYDDAFDLVYRKSKERKHYEPIICFGYPALHPNLTK